MNICNLISDYVGADVADTRIYRAYVQTYNLSLTGFTNDVVSIDLVLDLSTRLYREESLLPNLKMPTFLGIKEYPETY